MTRYSSTMTEALIEIREGFSPKQIKMAIGIAADKRYARGNYTGAVNAIEKIKKGLSDHPQVAAVLKRLNTDFDPELEEEIEIDEMKMNDPKLVKIFDKLKKGQTIKLKTSSTINQGKDFVEYIVKSKNVVNKGRVEKVTLVTKGNEGAVKKFLYKRDGKVTFAIGDMGASIDDIKEAAHELAEKLKVSDGVGAWIKDFQKSDAPQFQGKSEEDRKKMAIAAFADAGGKLEETELDEKREPYAVIDTADGNKVVGTASDEKGAKSIITSAELPPMKIKDKKTLKIVKVKKKQMIGQPIKEGTWHIPDSPKLKSGLKKLMLKPIKLGKEGDDATDKIGEFIGDDELYDDLYVAGKKNPNGDARPVIKKAMKRLGIREEDEKKMDKPDSAKMVDQGREDKKKTRIAQLQLQIAKAQETINKLNAQEKPNG